jgi:hypothetical protein
METKVLEILFFATEVLALVLGAVYSPLYIESIYSSAQKRRGIDPSIGSAMNFY